jgi:hypothetical protein
MRFHHFIYILIFCLLIGSGGYIVHAANTHDHQHDILPTDGCVVQLPPAGECVGAIPITTVTDPVALDMVNGKTVALSNLQPALQTALSCTKAKVQAAGGTLTVTSAYRPPQYQKYIQQIWDNHRNLKGNTDPKCTSFKATVDSEFYRRGLKEDAGARPIDSSSHTQGKAVDMVSSLGSAALKPLGTSCGFKSPPAGDEVHYAVP